MNVLDKFAIKKIDLVIVQAYEIKNDPRAYSIFKKNINLDHGIFFINFISTKERDKYIVMVKRKSYTYTYLYDARTNEITLKGERKNANS